jgi:hypothetical protein
MFIPIPIKINLNYKNSSLNLFLYNFKINFRKREKNKKKYNLDFLKKFDYNADNIKNILNNINFFKYKPKLNITIKLKIGFFDASTTALIYGILNSISSLIYTSLNTIFKINYYKLDIDPDFKNDVINIDLSSIVFVNLAKIIYIIILIKKNIDNINNSKNINFNI